MDATVECDGAGNAADLDAWLASNGGASATDACSGVTWSNDFDALSDDCGATGAATVTFTATDDCGNATSTTATFTIEDTTSPTRDSEAMDATVECDGAGNAADLDAWLASNGGATRNGCLQRSDLEQRLRRLERRLRSNGCGNSHLHCDGRLRQRHEHHGNVHNRRHDGTCCGGRDGRDG